MRLLHNIRISVFEYKDSENIEKIRPALKRLCGFNIDKILKVNEMDEFNDRILVTFEMMITKQQQIRSIINGLIENLSIEQIQMILEEKEKRLDENLHYYIRLEKEKLLKGKYFLTDSGNCFHIRLNIAAYPKKREIGLANLEKIFAQKA